jgi:hypothetical protein
VSKGSRRSASRVKPLRSQNSTATSRSRLASARLAGSRAEMRGRAEASTGDTVRSRAGRSWQARRTPGLARIRSSVAASAAPGAGWSSAPSRIRTRQVEQRPRPPQMDTCGTPPIRLASSTLKPRGIATARPSG